MSTWDIYIQKDWSKKTIIIKFVGLFIYFFFFLLFEDMHYFYKSWTEKILIKYVSTFVDIVFETISTPSNDKGYVFISVGLSVRLSVRLLAILRTNAWMECNKIFRINPASNKTLSEIFWGSLFHAWLDCFTFLILGAAEVCTLGVFLVNEYSKLGYYICVYILLIFVLSF